MVGVYCAFHTDRPLEGLMVFQLNLGRQSVLICNDCAHMVRTGQVTLSGL